MTVAEDGSIGAYDDDDVALDAAENGAVVSTFQPVICFYSFLGKKTVLECYCPS